VPTIHSQRKTKIILFLVKNQVLTLITTEIGLQGAVFYSDNVHTTYRTCTSFCRMLTSTLTSLYDENKLCVSYKKGSQKSALNV